MSYIEGRKTRSLVYHQLLLVVGPLFMEYAALHVVYPRHKLSAKVQLRGVMKKTYWLRRIMKYDVILRFTYLYVTPPSDLASRSPNDDKEGTEYENVQ